MSKDKPKLPNLDDIVVDFQFMTAREALSKIVNLCGKEAVMVAISYKGSKFVHADNITIGCISQEAKDLLDTTMKQYEQHVKEIKKFQPDYEPIPYSLAYWLIRWSGLIQPICTGDSK